MKTSVFIIIILCCFASYANGTAVAPKQLTLSVYYESLCTTCAILIGGDMYQAYLKLGDYVNFDLVPYGNTKINISTKGVITFTCQHGKRECAALKIQSCAQKYLTYDNYVDFIACTEQSNDPDKAGPSCAEDLDLKFEKIRKCSVGDEGTKLLYLNGVKTLSLKPRHTYTPWLLYNGVYLNTTEPNLFTEICTFLTHPKPTACNEIFA